MEKRLRLHIISDTNSEVTKEILSFEYHSVRMGSAPTLTATLYDYEILDIDNKCWAAFIDNDDNEVGEKFYIKQTPTSSKSNEDARYKYNLEFITERFVLDNIYFYDVVVDDLSEPSTISNSTDFVFNGTLKEYIEKLNASLNYTFDEQLYKIHGDGLNDSGDYKTITFKDKTITEALQEIYNTFGVKYYFDNYDVKLGDDDSKVIEAPVEYGAKGALISVAKQNANYKLVNRCSVIGSTDNIPYYYPNDSPFGKHECFVNSTDEEIKGIDYDLLGKSVDLKVDNYLKIASEESFEPSFSAAYKYIDTPGSSKDGIGYSTNENGNEVVKIPAAQMSAFVNVRDSMADFPPFYVYLTCRGLSMTSLEVLFAPSLSLGDAWYIPVGATAKCEWEAVDTTDSTNIYSGSEEFDSGGTFKITFKTKNAESKPFKLTLNISVKAALKENPADTTSLPSRWLLNEVDLIITRKIGSTIANDAYFKIGTKDGDSIYYGDEKYGYNELGLPYSVNEYEDGTVFKVTAGHDPLFESKNLLPSIYRGTNGVERFYEARKTDTYTYTQDGYEVDYNIEGAEVDGWESFFSPIDANSKHLYREHIFSAEDIKPTIKDVSYNGKRIDQIVDVAFDNTDDNSVEGDELVHAHFFVKLNPLGFNLFDMALEQGEMTLSMTSGRCMSCNFIIAVGEETKKNIVQVDSNGDLVRDSKGNVKLGSPQDEQNDTTNNSVWIALKKEDSTFGTWMPNSKANEVPRADDTFVIINIKLPMQYVIAAEKKLECEAIKYLKANNIEKFSTEIRFSRIFLAENKQFLECLNENSKLSVSYQDAVQEGLYVTAFNYKMDGNAPLPEIQVTLSDMLTVGSRPMQNIVNRVEAELYGRYATQDDVNVAFSRALSRNRDESTPHSFEANTITSMEDMTSNGGLNVMKGSTFRGKAEFMEDVIIGGYSEINGDITGAKIDKEGNIKINSLKANRLEVSTLQYNNIEATSAYTAFDDTATIVSVIPSEENVNIYTLTLDGDFRDPEKFEYVQPFQEDDILFGEVNKINALSKSSSGTCWLLVKSVDSDNTITVMLYSDKETPDGKNLAPSEDMTIMHRGNANPDKHERQSTFYVSSKDGNIVQLLGVTSPKLLNINKKSADGNSYSNYGVVMGKLPEDLREYINKVYKGAVTDTDPALYAKSLAVENLFMIDYAGQPVRTQNFRGLWERGAIYRMTNTIYDTVTYNGSWWGTTLDNNTGNEPGTTTAWVKIVSKGADGEAVAANPNIINNSNFSKGIESWDVVQQTEGVRDVDNGVYYSSLDNNTSRLDVLKYDLKETLIGSTWYTFSFETRGWSGNLSYGENHLFPITTLIWNGINENEGQVVDVDEPFIKDDRDVTGDWLVNKNIGSLAWYVTNKTEDEFNNNNDWIKHTLSFKTRATISDTAVLTVRQWKNSYFEIKNIKLEEGGIATPWTTSEEDKVAESLYPHGEWQASVLYKIENNCAPFVWYKDSYYVLKASSSQGDIPSSSKKWKRFSYFQYIFAEFLMAKWATFGSDKGGVFYDKYLFSQYGVDKDGKYGQYPKTMFDENENLTKEFTPSLYINFYDGEIKTNKLSETYQEYKYTLSSVYDYLYANELLANESYNVKYGNSDVPTQDGNNAWTGRAVSILTMPLYDDITYDNIIYVNSQKWEPDGMRSNVLVRCIRNWERRAADTLGTRDYTWVDEFTSLSQSIHGCLLLCADPRWLNPYAWKCRLNNGEVTNFANDASDDEDNGSYGEDGRFVIGGVFTNWILVEPGQQVILRSCRTNGKVYWYVENSSEFGEIECGLTLNLSQAFDMSSKKLINISYSTNLGTDEHVYGYARAIYASNTLCKLQEHFKGDAAKLQIDIDTLSRDENDDWDWVKTIDVINVSNGN